MLCSFKSDIDLTVLLSLIYADFHSHYILDLFIFFLSLMTILSALKERHRNKRIETNCILKKTWD